VSNATNLPKIKPRRLPRLGGQYPRKLLPVFRPILNPGNHTQILTTTQKHQGRPTGKPKSGLQLTLDGFVDQRTM
jgi:hypothetical protein